MVESDSTLKQSKLQRHPRLVWRRFVRLWPLVVWVLILCLVVWLYAGSVHYGSITGVIETVAEEVAPIETSRLLSVDVSLGQQVQAGDVIAHMDTSLLDATLAVEEASALDVAQNITQYQESILRMARQFEQAISDNQAEYLQERRQEAESAAELVELQKELKRRERLLARKLIREEDVNILRPKIAALEISAKAYPEIVEAYRQRVETARKEYVDMRAWLELEEGEDISAAIRRKRQASQVILETATRYRMIQREGYVLKASRAGEVSRVFYAPGEVIAAGDPVVRIVARQSEHVIGFLQESQLAHIQQGQQVQLWGRGFGSRLSVHAVVQSISPEVQGLPGRLNPLGGATVRGRRMMLRFIEPHQFIPGQTVEILIERPTWLQWVDRQLHKLTRKTETVSGEEPDAL
jgi:multidrug resistance efflux pump